ncbi:MAG: ABC transporter substrate-binding protein [Desulfobacteraceae bacterium]|nr:ABC transporter substrate-binding protein [Desulfobacteraceae bacterium]
MRNGKLILFIAALLTLSLIGPVSTTMAANDQIVIGWQQDTITLDPGRAYEMYTNLIIAALYDPLVKFGDSIDVPKPYLITDYSVSDSKVYTFNLKPGIKFSTGNPLTAADVKWTFERLKHLKSNASFLAKNIENIKAVDARTVVVTLADPDAAFLSKIATSSFGILDSKRVRANGGQADTSAAETDKAQTWLDTNSVGCGPYVLEKFSRDREIILVRNKTYHGPKPAAEKIVLRHIPDLSAQMLMVKKGDIDIAFNLGPEQVKLLKKDKQIKILPSAGLSMTFLLMNQNPEVGGPFANPHVREAVKYAVDYKGLQMLAGDGSVTPLSVIQVGFLGALPPRDPDFTNLDKAKELLAKGGFPGGFKGTISAITYNFEGVDWVMVAEKIKNDLGKIGIELTVKPQDFSVGLNDYRTGKWSFAVSGWGPDYPDVNNQLAFLPGNSVGLRAQWNADSRPDLTALGEKAMVETDNVKRSAYIENIQRLMDKDSPFLNLIQHPKQLVVRSNIDGAKWHEAYKLKLEKLVKK